MTCHLSQPSEWRFHIFPPNLSSKISVGEKYWDKIPARQGLAVGGGGLLGLAAFVTEMLCVWCWLKVSWNHQVLPGVVLSGRNRQWLWLNGWTPNASAHPVVKVAKKLKPFQFQCGCSQSHLSIQFQPSYHANLIFHISIKSNLFCIFQWWAGLYHSQGTHFLFKHVSFFIKKGL